MMQKLTGTEKELSDYRLAMAVADGLPRRAQVVGGPDMLPTEYTPGAPGWTEQVCEAPIAEDGVYALEVPEEAAKYFGEAIELKPGVVVVIGTPDKDEDPIDVGPIDAEPIDPIGRKQP